MRLAPVAGAYFAELPPSGDPAQPASSPARSSTRTRWPSWCTRSREIGSAPAGRGAPASGRGPLRADHGRAPLAGHPGGRARHHPGDRPGDRRRRHAPRRAAGEPAPVAAQPAGGGGGLRASCSTTSAAPTRSWPARIGRSRPQISNTLRLLKLPPAVQRRVAAGVLSAGHARALLAIDDPELQDRLAARVVAEGISVRALEEIVAMRRRRTRREPRRGRKQADGAGAGRPGRAPLGPVRDPGQGRPRPQPRARSPWSSPPSTTCSGSSTSWTRATATDRPI